MQIPQQVFRFHHRLEAGLDQYEQNVSTVDKMEPTLFERSSSLHLFKFLQTFFYFFNPVFTHKHQNPILIIQLIRRSLSFQFNNAVLPAVMFLMEKSRLDSNERANAVKVVRAVAALVNSHDENGLLVGNWSGSYESGTPPWQWTGSAGILEQYLRSSGHPVKFGQCWVFAGVTTTVCRALGKGTTVLVDFFMIMFSNCIN